MKGLLLALAMGATLAFTAFTFGYAAGPASAHRSWCHSRHDCPSDHATYRWHGLLCVKPSADERTSSFKKRVRYGGRTYYCKR